MGPSTKPFRLREWDRLIAAQRQPIGVDTIVTVEAKIVQPVIQDDVRMLDELSIRLSIRLEEAMALHAIPIESADENDRRAVRHFAERLGAQFAGTDAEGV